MSRSIALSVILIVFVSGCQQFCSPSNFALNDLHIGQSQPNEKDAQEESDAIREILEASKSPLSIAIVDGHDDNTSVTRIRLTEQDFHVHLQLKNSSDQPFVIEEFRGGSIEFTIIDENGGPCGRIDRKNCSPIVGRTPPSLTIGPNQQQVLEIELHPDLWHLPFLKPDKKTGEFEFRIVAQLNCVTCVAIDEKERRFFAAVQSAPICVKLGYYLQEPAKQLTWHPFLAARKTFLGWLIALNLL